MYMKVINNELTGYLIHLLDCGLKGKKPEEKPEGISFEQIFDLACKHSVANLAYYGIEKLERQPEETLCKQWKEVRDKAIVKGITQLYERDLIVERLTAAGIDICPLKGCLLKEMYPQQDMRTMSDLDILMEPGKAEAVENILKSLGYKMKLEYHSGHDVYNKEPVMDVEMHHVLMDLEAVEETYLKYYENPWKCLKADKENPHLYRMNWDDYYVYLIAHLAKHCQLGGTGIRSIMDIHVFLQCHGTDLNQDYLKEELQKMGLLELKQRCESLAEVWFGAGEPKKAFEELTEYIVRSGTYGNTQRTVMHMVEKGVTESGDSRLRYLLHRLFPSKEKMQRKYRSLKKYPFLLPLCWGLRLIRCLTDTKKRKRLKVELKVAKQSK